MKNCTDFIDSLSAYADGELSGSDKQSVENHLAVCESCSAFLEVYREITISVEETSVNPPEALRIGVMNRVMSEKIPGAADGKKKRGHFYFALTRYAPIAACLVVMLLVWQFWGDTWGINTRNTSTGEAMPLAATTTDSAAPAAPAPEVAPDTYGIIDDDMDMGHDFNSEPQPAGGADSPSATPQLNTRMDEEETALSEAGSQSAQEIDEILAFIEGAHTEFLITGELPARLEGREPLPFSPWFGWEMVFEIPDTEVLILMAELSGRDDVTVNAIKNESTYGIVFYSP